MVQSIDGSTIIEGHSTRLSSPVDTEVVLALRRAADTIIVGAGTVRADGYGEPASRGQRVGVVTRTGRLDFDSPLFTSGAGFLIMPNDAPAPRAAVDVVRAGTHDVDLPAAMRQIHGDFAQLEGGPALNASMFTADLVDEINVTVSPQVTGSDSPRLLRDAPPLHERYTLSHVLEDEGFLFLRYLREDRGAA
jgi:riboflavin biosynthesis pyrimidine reductase